MWTQEEPLCTICDCWRDYRDDIDSHPDYDGHCWYRGIMTLDVRFCPCFDGVHQPKAVYDPIVANRPKPEDGQYKPNAWDDWKKQAEKKQRKDAIWEIPKR